MRRDIRENQYAKNEQAQIWLTRLKEVYGDNWIGWCPSQYSPSIPIPPPPVLPFAYSSDGTTGASSYTDIYVGSGGFGYVPANYNKLRNIQSHQVLSVPFSLVIEISPFAGLMDDLWIGLTDGFESDHTTYILAGTRFQTFPGGYFTNGAQEIVHLYTPPNNTFAGFNGLATWGGQPKTLTIREDLTGVFMRNGLASEVFIGSIPANVMRTGDRFFSIAYAGTEITYSIVAAAHD